MRAALACVIAIGCGGSGPSEAPGDAAGEPDAPPDAAPPSFDTLQGTGLCSDAGCTVFAPDVREYEPRAALWADTATKRRWIALPPGTRIDTTDMNRWVFPVGTRLWKEFARDGTRVETRFMTKVLEDESSAVAWFYVTYEWDAAQTTATPRTNGVTDANGTGHDIPSRAQCRECHESVRPGRVLGFQAIQLDGDILEDLIAADLLTAPPTTGAPGARFPLPGTARDREVLLYLHANCGHCHNATAASNDVTPLETNLDVTKLGSLQETLTFSTSVERRAGMPFSVDGVDYETIIVPGSAATSNLMFRMTAPDVRHMPKLGSEVVDPDGLALLTGWIDAL